MLGQTIADILQGDARHVLRRIARAPGVAATVVVSLAVGMSAVIALVGVVDTLFFREPAGMRDPARVVAIGPWSGFERTTFPDYVDLRDQTRALESVAAFAFWNYSARVGNAVAPARGLLASSSLLPTLGIQPSLGRVFTRDEDRSRTAGVALVGAAFRREQFTSDAAALGATIRLAGTDFTVIGVLPASFTAPDMSPVDLVLPIENAPWFGGREALVNRDYQWVRIVGRLRPGIGPAAASAEASAIYRRANVGVRSVDQTTLAHERVAVRSLREARVDARSSSGRVSIWLAVLAGVVLIIACANVASVLVARGIGDAPELAIHVALGASRQRLAMRSLTEVAVLVGVATLLGLVVAAAVSRTLTTLLLANTVVAPPLDARTAVVAALVAGLTCAVSALAPVRRATRTDPQAVLGSHSRTMTGAHARALRVLVGAQIGLGVVLVSEAAVFAASLRNATRSNLGFDLTRLVVADVDLRAAGLSETTAAGAEVRALESVRRIPGVMAAGMTNGATIPGFLNPPLVVPGRDSAPAGIDESEPYVNSVTPGFLEALAVPLRRGRMLADHDVTGRRPVALVSERFARLFWPGMDPIGQCVRVGRLTTTPCAQVVGVVGDRRGGPTAVHGVAELYLPSASAAFPGALAKTFLSREMAVRIAGPGEVIARLQRVLLDEIPALTSVRVRVGDAYLESQTRPWRLGAIVIGAFAVLALLLAAVGVFGAWSHAVATRRRELGIRGALGATPVDLAWLVLRAALAVAAVGLVAGLIVSMAVARLVSSMTFGISPLDLRVLVATAIVFALVTCAATIGPALRAALTDPRNVLAAE